MADQPYWNPSDKDTGHTLSNSNKTSTQAANNAGSVRSVAGLSSGKWYVEFDFSGNTGLGLGTSSAGITNFPGFGSQSWCLYTANGNKYNNNNPVSYGSAPATSIVGMAVDLDNDKVWWRDANGWFNSGDPAAGTGAAYTNITGTMYLMCGAGGTSGTKVHTLRNLADYSWSPPTGFTAGWGGTTSNTYDESAGMDLSLTQTADVANVLGLAISAGVVLNFLSERQLDAAASAAIETTLGLVYATQGQLEPTITFAAELDFSPLLEAVLQEALTFALSLDAEQVGGTLYGASVDFALLFDLFSLPSSAYDDSLTFGLSLGLESADNLGDIELSVDWALELDLTSERGREWADAATFALSLAYTAAPGNVVGVATEYELVLALATAGDRGTLNNSVGFAVNLAVFEQAQVQLEPSISMDVSLTYGLAVQGNLQPTVSFGLSQGFTGAAQAVINPTLLFGLGIGLTQTGGLLLERAVTLELSVRMQSEIVDYDFLAEISETLDLGLFESFEAWLSKKLSPGTSFTPKTGSATTWTPAAPGVDTSYAQKDNKEDPDWQAGNTSRG